MLATAMEVTVKVIVIRGLEPVVMVMSTTILGACFL